MVGEQPLSVHESKKADITIVLATYRGGSFLQQQVDSIRNQDYVDWLLLARDDASNDESGEVLERFSEMDPRIRVWVDAEGNLGAKANSSFLLKKAATLPCDYFALSDQDDIWVANKLSEQLKVMRRVEQQNPGVPILLHADLEVVDAALHPIAPSLMRYQDIKHETSDPLNVLLVQNFVTGCTVVINRPLLEIALPIPKEALMHDWWLALCAAVCGKIEYIDKPLVKYRQHGNNVVGAKHLDDFLNPFTGKWKKRWLEGKDNLFQSMKQAQALADRIREREPENPNLSLVEAYASLADMPPLQRMRKLRELGIHAQSGIRQMLLLFRLLLAA